MQNIIYNIYKQQSMIFFTIILFNVTGQLQNISAKNTCETSVQAFSTSGSEGLEP